MPTEPQLGLDFSLTDSASQIGQRPDGWSSKTCPDFSAANTAKTLRLWLEHWLGAKLMYRETDGEMPASSLDLRDSSSGPYWTRNSSEWRSGAVVCSLSETLETGRIARRYYLSPKACAGILRRAEKLGKVLPEQLAIALRAVVDSERILNAGGAR
jgi:hypothetical protein